MKFIFFLLLVAMPFSVGAYGDQKGPSAKEGNAPREQEQKDRTGTLNEPTNPTDPVNRGTIQEEERGTKLTDPAGKNVDNTGINVRDRTDKGNLTPTDQSATEADRAITQQLRQLIVQEDQLSTNAKNIKIITQNGLVTLRGPVNNNEEKNYIDSLVKQAQGVKEVQNQLEIVNKN